MLLLLFAACGDAGSTLSAEDELTLSATAGTEEALVGEGLDHLADPGAPPDPFRECDAEGDFDALFDAYDADADGDLGPSEEDAVHDARGDRPPEDEAIAMGMMAMLLTVYDLDGDAALSDSERATLLDDFTVRCETMQARLLEDFDADGDGVLSDEEKDTARDALASGAPEGAPPPPDSASAPPPPGECEPGDVPPELMDAFDADGDGTLSDTELATLRDTMREAIRAGDPVLGPPPPPPRE